MSYIVPFEQSDLLETIFCMSRTFALEPMSQALGINANSYVSIAKCIAQKAVEDGLSLVVKEETSNHVIGFAILEDFVTKDYNPYYYDPLFNANPYYVDYRFNPIIDLTAKLYDEWYIKNYSVTNGEILHILMIGIDKEYQGRAIFQKLMKEILNVGKKNNYKSLIGEATGFIIQKTLVKRYGFNVLKEIEYKSYLYYGNPVFKDIKENLSCQLMMKTYS